MRVRLSPTVTQLAVALDVEHDSISHLFFYCDGPALRGSERGERERSGATIALFKVCMPCYDDYY